MQSCLWSQQYKPLHPLLNYTDGTTSSFRADAQREIDQKKIEEFLSDYEGITYSQTSIMIDVYGESLSVVGHKDTYNLSDLRLDIGMVKQNETKDLLLNSKHEKVTIHEGEIGIPVLLKEVYGMKIGIVLY